MPIESERARISFSDSTNSLTLAQDEGPGQPSEQHKLFLSKKNRPNSTILQPCKPHWHQAWTKPNALSCSVVLSNSCSWICDPHSQRCYRNSREGSTTFLEGSCSRGKESLGCHSRGHFRLGRQEKCPENLYYGKILVKTWLFHKQVPGGLVEAAFPPGNWSIASAVTILWCSV